MYSGFVTAQKSVARLGTHQKFDREARRLIQHYLKAGRFPDTKTILYFEGYGGPDGLKVKGNYPASHFYDPIKDVGELPERINSHFKHLVGDLRDRDVIRAGFEAAWMAHYITDGLTPAHHFSDAEVARQLAEAETYLRKQRARLDVISFFSTHFNFEMGVVTALLGNRRATEFDEMMLSRATKLGPVEFFKEEARKIAELKVYEQFSATGWSKDLLRLVREQIAPRIPQVIATIWLMAYLEASKAAAIGA